MNALARQVEAIADAVETRAIENENPQNCPDGGATVDLAAVLYEGACAGCGAAVRVPCPLCLACLGVERGTK